MKNMTLIALVLAILSIPMALISTIGLIIAVAVTIGCLIIFILSYRRKNYTARSAAALVLAIIAVVLAGMVTTAHKELVQECTRQYEHEDSGEDNNESIRNCIEEKLS